jgi:hypothetical protein
VIVAGFVIVVPTVGSGSPSKPPWTMSSATCATPPGS